MYLPTLPQVDERAERAGNGPVSALLSRTDAQHVHVQQEVRRSYDPEGLLAAADWNLPATDRYYTLN